MLFYNIYIKSRTFPGLLPRFDGTILIVPYLDNCSNSTDILNNPLIYLSVNVQSIFT